MDKEQLEHFLAKLKLNELRALSKRLSIKVERGDTKDQLIEKVVDGSSSPQILAQLGLNNAPSGIKENESLTIARKSLENQTKQRRITSMGVAIALTALLTTVYINWSKLFPATELPEEHLVQNRPSEGPTLFQDTTSYNILLLPFGASQRCKSDTVICEREVQSRFNLLIEQDHDLDIEVQIFRGVDTQQQSLSFKRAREIGDSLYADLVVYGDYENQCDWDSTKIRVKWASMGMNVPFLDPVKDAEYMGVKEMAEIEEGEITGNVEEIVFWGLGIREFDAHHYQQALDYFQKIDKAERIEYVELYYRIGYCFSRLGRETKNTDLQHQAMDYFSTVHDLMPTDILSLQGRAFIHHNLGDYQKAVDDYSKALQLHPANALAFNNRGAAYHKMKDYPKAIADYSKAIAFGFKTAMVYNSRGGLYHTIKEDRKAVRDYSKAIELQPNSLPAYSGRGVAYYALGNYQKAIADYSVVLKAEPDNALIYNNRAGAYHQLNAYQEAISDYSKAIQLGFVTANIYGGRGGVYHSSGAYPKAVADFSKAIQLDPDNGILYNNRGGAYHGLKAYRKALTDYSKAIELGFVAASTYTTRGTTYYILEDYPKAITDFSKAIQLAPDNGLIYNSRADAYYQMGDLVNAKQDQEKAQSLGFNAKKY